MQHQEAPQPGVMSSCAVPALLVTTPLVRWSATQLTSESALIMHALTCTGDIAVPMFSVADPDRVLA